MSEQVPNMIGATAGAFGQNKGLACHWGHDGINLLDRSSLPGHGPQHYTQGMPVTIQATSKACNESLVLIIQKCSSGSEYLVSVVLPWWEGCNGSHPAMENVKIDKDVMVTRAREADISVVLPLTIVLALVAAFGLLGNFSVIYRSRKARLAPNDNSLCVVLFFAVVGLLSCLLVIPGAILQAWYYSFGHDVVCKLWQLLRHSMIFIPSLALLTVALDNFTLIRHPARSNRCQTALRWSLLGTLVTGVSLAIPPMLTSGTHVPLKNTDMLVNIGLCVNNYVTITRASIRIYWLVIAVLYLLLTATLGVIYGLIPCVLYSRKNNGTLRGRSINDNNQTVRRSSTITIIENFDIGDDDVFSEDPAGGKHDRSKNRTRRKVDSQPSDMSESNCADRHASFITKQSKLARFSEMASRVYGLLCAVLNCTIFNEPRDEMEKSLMFRNHTMYPDYVNDLVLRSAEIRARSESLELSEPIEACGLCTVTNSMSATIKHETKRPESPSISVSSFTTEVTDLPPESLNRAGNRDSIARTEEADDNEKTRALPRGNRKFNQENSKSSIRRVLRSDHEKDIKVVGIEDETKVDYTKGLMRMGKVSERNEEMVGNDRSGSELSWRKKSASTSQFRGERSNSDPGSVLRKRGTSIIAMADLGEIEDEIRTDGMDQNRESTVTAKDNKPRLTPSEAWDNHVDLNKSPESGLEDPDRVNKLSTNTEQLVDINPPTYKRTIIIWAAVTGTFLMAYIPMISIQIKIITGFPYSEFLYFCFFFTTALNPLIVSFLTRQPIEEACDTCSSCTSQRANSCFGSKFRCQCCTHE